MKKVIFIAAALCALAACNKEVISAPEEGFGILNLSVASDSNVIVATKTGETETTTVPTDNFTVNIVNDENKVVKTGPASSLKVVVLPADTYTVNAENITESKALTNNDGKGELRMAGSVAPFTLTQSDTKGVSVVCNPTNSKITVTYDQSFTNAFNAYSVNLAHSGDRDFNTITAGTEYFYNITSGAYVDVILSATSKAGVSVGHTQKINLEAAHHYAVTYSATTDGQLTINVTASNVLTPTNINVPVNPYTPAN